MSCSNMSDCCVISGHNFDKPLCSVFIGLGGTLLLTWLILFGITCTQCRRLKGLKHYGEGSSYKRSKTCKHYRLSMRELQEQEDAWDKENGFSSFEPMITIGSAFDSPHHGPTPPLPPPPPKEYLNTDCKATGTDGYARGSGQTSNLAEHHVEKTFPLKSPHSKTLSNELERRYPDDFDNELDDIAAVRPLFSTPHHRLDQPKRQNSSDLLDAGYNRPNGWRHHPDDNNPYSLGKITDLESLGSDEEINGNNTFNVNDILMHADITEIIHDITSAENMHEHSASAKEDDNTPEYINSLFRQSLSSYIDMTSSQNRDEYVQMKITLSWLAASEICRKARLRGIKCNSDALFGHVMDKPRNSGFICGLACEDFDEINAVYIEITD